MICADLQWETRGERPLSADEKAHVASCPNCQADERMHAALRAGRGPSDALSAKILADAHAAIAAEPVAKPWSRAWLSASLGGLLIALAAVPLLHPRADLSQLGMALAMNATLLLAVFALAGRAAFGPGLVPRGRWLTVALAVAAGGSLLLCPGSHPDEGVGSMRCFAAILAVSAIPLLAFFALLRLRTRSWLTGACAGVAAGALGEAAMFLHCPHSGLSHMLGSHLTAWLTLAIAGALLLGMFPARLWTGRAQ